MVREEGEHYLQCDLKYGCEKQIFMKKSINLVDHILVCQWTITVSYSFQTRIPQFSTTFFQNNIFFTEKTTFQYKLIDCILK